ncbi:hypothetical protein N0V90_003460 [Kalmusia sp. IMI 367209]|nr:hypothetical protein N0V90_003460 [Kalmusia sp. IMI 367209]
MAANMGVKGSVPTINRALLFRMWKVRLPKNPTINLPVSNMEARHFAWGAYGASAMGTNPNKPVAIRKSHPLNLAKASFSADGGLSAEVRNEIYEYCLKSPSTIQLVWDPQRAAFVARPRSLNCKESLNVFPEVLALRFLSSLDHKVREEARSFFFANNRFEVFSLKPVNHYMKAYVAFLHNIGSVGRASLRYLRMDLVDEERERDCSADMHDVKNFFGLLGECVNLEALWVTLGVSCFYGHDFLTMARYLKHHGPMPHHPHSGVLKQLQKLTYLKRLWIDCTISQRWNHEHIQCYTALGTRTMLATWGRCDRSVEVDLLDQIHHSLVHSLGSGLENVSVLLHDQGYFHGDIAFVRDTPEFEDVELW